MKRTRHGSEPVYTVRFNAQVYSAYVEVDGPGDAGRAKKWAGKMLALDRTKYFNAKSGRKKKKKSSNPPKAHLLIDMEATGIYAQVETTPFVLRNKNKTNKTNKTKNKTNNDATTTTTSSSSSTSTPAPPSIPPSTTSTSTPPSSPSTPPPLRPERFRIHTAVFEDLTNPDLPIQVWFLEQDGKAFRGDLDLSPGMRGHMLPDPSHVRSANEVEDLTTLAVAVQAIGETLRRVGQEWGQQDWSDEDPLIVALADVSSLIEQRMVREVERQRKRESEQESSVPPTVRGYDYAYERAIHPDDVEYADEMRVPGTIVQQVGGADGVFIRRALFPVSKLRLRVVPIDPHTVMYMRPPPEHSIVFAMLGETLVRADVYPGDKVKDGGVVVINEFCTPGIGVYIGHHHHHHTRSTEWYNVGEVLSEEENPDPSGVAFRFRLNCAVHVNSDPLSPRLELSMARHAAARLAAAAVPEVDPRVAAAVEEDGGMAVLTQMAWFLLENPGSKVGICGPAGSGTSTAARLLVTKMASLDGFGHVYADGLCWPRQKKNWTGVVGLAPALPLADGRRLHPSRSFLLVLDDMGDQVREYAFSSFLPSSSSSLIAVATTTPPSYVIPPVFDSFDLVYDVVSRTLVVPDDEGDMGRVVDRWDVRYPMLRLDPELAQLAGGPECTLEELPHAPHAHFLAAMLEMSPRSSDEVVRALVTFAADALVDEPGKPSKRKFVDRNCAMNVVGLSGSFAWVSPLRTKVDPSTVGSSSGGVRNFVTASSYVGLKPQRLGENGSEARTPIEDLDVLEGAGCVQKVQGSPEGEMYKVSPLAWRLVGSVLAVFASQAVSQDCVLDRKVWYPVIGYNETECVVDDPSMWSTESIEDDLPPELRAMVCEAWDARVSRAVLGVGQRLHEIGKAAREQGPGWQSGRGGAKQRMNPLWWWSSGLIPLQYPISLSVEALEVPMLLGVFLFRSAVGGLEGWLTETDAAVDGVDEGPGLEPFFALRQAVLGGEIGTAVYAARSPIKWDLTRGLEARGRLRHLWNRSLRSWAENAILRPATRLDQSVEQDAVAESLVPRDALHDSGAWSMVIPPGVEVVGGCSIPHGVLLVWEVRDGEGEERMMTGCWDVDAEGGRCDLDSGNPSSVVSLWRARDVRVMEGGWVLVQAGTLKQWREPLWAGEWFAYRWEREGGTWKFVLPKDLPDLLFSPGMLVGSDWGKLIAHSVRVRGTWLCWHTPYGWGNHSWWFVADVGGGWGVLAHLVGRVEEDGSGGFVDVVVGLLRGFNECTSSDDVPEPAMRIHAPEGMYVQSVGGGRGVLVCVLVDEATCGVSMAVFSVGDLVGTSWVADAPDGVRGRCRVEELRGEEEVGVGVGAVEVSVSPVVDPRFETVSGGLAFRGGQRVRRAAPVEVLTEEMTDGSELVVRTGLSLLEWSANQKEVLVIEGRGGREGRGGWRWRVWAQTEAVVVSQFIYHSVLGRGARLMGGRTVPEPGKVVWESVGERGREWLRIGGE